jgi:hypothetical protein
MAGPGQQGTNQFNVRVPPLDFSKREAPASQTYHGITITVNGNIVGRIQNWSVNVFQRTITHVRELNHNTFGRPIDIVPSINDGYTITANRVEVWGEELEKAVGYALAYDDLINQTYPFAAKEMWFKGTQIYRIVDYHGCWFNNTDLESWDVTGDAIIKRAVGITFCSRSVSLGK